MHNKRTYFESIQIDLTGQIDLDIGTRLASQILYIYGISTYLSGVTPNSENLIVPGDDLNLYLSLRDGANDFIEDIRLSDLVFSNDVRVKHYPVWFPGNLSAVSRLDLDKSQISNPTLITGRSILLNFWYIPVGMGYEKYLNEYDQEMMDREPPRG